MPRRRKCCLAWEQTLEASWPRSGSSRDDGNNDDEEMMTQRMTVDCVCVCVCCVAGGDKEGQASYRQRDQEEDSGRETAATRHQQFKGGRAQVSLLQFSSWHFRKPLPWTVIVQSQLSNCNSSGRSVKLLYPLRGCVYGSAVRAIFTIFTWWSFSSHSEWGCPTAVFQTTSCEWNSINHCHFASTRLISLFTKVHPTHRFYSLCKSRLWMLLRTSDISSSFMLFIGFRELLPNSLQCFLPILTFCFWYSASDWVAQGHNLPPTHEAVS